MAEVAERGRKVEQHSWFGQGSTPYKLVSWRRELRPVADEEMT